MTLTPLASSNTSTILDPGFPVQLIGAATAKVSSGVFCVQNGGILNITALNTGSPTTITATLERSTDGVTFNADPNQVSTDFLDNPEQSIPNIAPGYLYQLVLSTLSGGSSPAVTFNASLDRRGLS